MAEETLVKEQLTPEMITVGRDMTLSLVQTEFDLLCSLWLYSPESNRWGLVLASPVVGRDGPRRAYEFVEKVLQDNWEMDIWLQNISVVSPSHPLVTALRSLGRFDVPLPGQGPTPRAMVNRRFTRSRVGDIFVEDAYIYLLH
jgi:hypothetical protein